jgi:hypothetical protein
MLIAISVLPLERSRQKKKLDGPPSCSVIIIGSLPAAKPQSRIITLITAQLCRSLVPRANTPELYCGELRSLNREAFRFYRPLVPETGFEFAAKAWMNASPAGGPGPC